MNCSPFTSLHNRAPRVLCALALMLALSALHLPTAPTVHTAHAADAGAERGVLSGRSMGAGGALPATRAASPNPYPHNSLHWSLFNATASMLGLPGLVSPVDGLQDEGLGFHADGTTRRAGGADGVSGSGGAGAYPGQRAASYARSGGYGGVLGAPWLYDDVLGIRRDA